MSNWRASGCGSVKVKINTAHSCSARLCSIGSPSLMASVWVCRLFTSQRVLPGGKPPQLAAPFCLHLLSGERTDRHFLASCISRKTWCVFGPDLIWICQFSTAHYWHHRCVFSLTCASVIKGPESEGWGKWTNSFTCCCSLRGNGRYCRHSLTLSTEETNIK